MYYPTKKERKKLFPQLSHSYYLDNTTRWPPSLLALNGLFPQDKDNRIIQIRLVKEKSRSSKELSTQTYFVFEKKMFPLQYAQEKEV
jgi:hypothetical protein